MSENIQKKIKRNIKVRREKLIELQKRSNPLMKNKTHTSKDIIDSFDAGC